MKKPLLGILGGLGPASSVYFYHLITSHTAASCDADHLDIILSSDSSTPDRTDFILGKSNVSPMSHMLYNSRKLIEYGADYIAIPCNTAHYFYDELTEKVDKPVINIIGETIEYLNHTGCKKIGLLATDGTVKSGAYYHVCAKYGIECIVPGENEQKGVMDIIYSQIKAGKAPDEKLFSKISDALFERGCENIVLGCTELSLMKKIMSLDDRFTDSLEVLACRCITLCGAQAIGFDDKLIKYEDEKANALTTTLN